MEAWIIILGIILLRGLSAWYRRRQTKERQAELPGQGRPRPEPGDPDAFDVEEFDPRESGWRPPWDRPAPVPAPPSETPAWRPPDSGPLVTDENRQRREMLQRLALAADKRTQASGALESPVLTDEDRPHPHADRGAWISHRARRASSLQAALRSSLSCRQAVLLREVLGPPVAIRGSLRDSRCQPR